MVKKLFWSALLVLTPCLQAEDIRSAIHRANRKTNAKMVRSAVTNAQAVEALVAQPTNGDEQRYADKRGSYGKGLKQLDTGLVDPAAFQTLVFATQTGNPTDFDAIEMALDPRQRGLHSPQAGISFNLWAADSGIFTVPAPPAVASAQKAAEMVELYWMSILADTPFTDYDTVETTAAIADLNNLSDFRGPKVDGEVTPQTLFRSNVPGALVGPYVSQLLLLPVPFSDTTFAQQYRVPLPFEAFSPTVINNFLTNVDQWKFIQEGNNPTLSITFDDTQRYIQDARDLGSFVHKDPPQLPWLFASCILFSFGNAAQDAGNPYLTNPTQEMFAEFFMPQLITLVSLAGEMGIRAAWYQKWFVHRTLRPEEYGFLVHQQKTGAFDYGLNSDVINSAALPEIFTSNNIVNTFLGTPGGTYLLPQQYPEGCPIHPSYPAGHATCAGACATILKAWFNEDFVFPDTFVPDALGTSLVSVPDTPVTVGGELNKMAANIAIGRNMAGVHYRCDMDESLKLGEAVAIKILEAWAYTNNINFKGFSLTKFDGTKITIGGNKRIPLL